MKESLQVARTLIQALASGDLTEDVGASIGMIVKARKLIDEALAEIVDDDTHPAVRAAQERATHFHRVTIKQAEIIRCYRPDWKSSPGSIHGGAPCCNPECGGHWGANCPHCHRFDHECPNLELTEQERDMRPPDGQKAEELRKGIEDLLDKPTEGFCGQDVVDAAKLQDLLDQVDARDSLEYPQSQDKRPSCERCGAVVSDLYWLKGETKSDGLCEDCYDTLSANGLPVSVERKKNSLRCNHCQSMVDVTVDGICETCAMNIYRGWSQNGELVDAKEPLEERIHALESWKEEQGRLSRDARFRLDSFAKSVEQLESKAVHATSKLDDAGLRVVALEDRFDAFRQEVIDKFSEEDDTLRAYREDFRKLRTDMDNAKSKLSQIEGDYANGVDLNIYRKFFEERIDKAMLVVGDNATKRLDEIDAAWREKVIPLEKDMERIEGLLRILDRKRVDEASEEGSLRELVSEGKYTRAFTAYTDDELAGILWLVGEFSARMTEEDFSMDGVRGARRRAIRALQLLSKIRYTPLTLDEVRREMRQAIYSERQGKDSSDV